MLAGFGSKEVRAVLDRAEALADHLGAEKPLLLLFHRYTDHVSRSDLKTGLSLSSEFSQRATESWRRSRRIRQSSDSRISTTRGHLH